MGDIGSNVDDAQQRAGRTKTMVSPRTKALHNLGGPIEIPQIAETGESMSVDDLDPMSAEVGTRGLHVLGGRPAPSEVFDGWNAFLDLSSQARGNIWPLLAGVLLQPNDPENANRLEIFVERHGGSLERTEAAITTVVDLLRQAAARSLPAKSFEADLVAISKGRPGFESIMSRYERTISELRLEILQGSLADHGKLMTGADWRIDHMSVSDRGTDLNAPVLLLTLRYQEGSKSDRITLQLLPDAVQKLRSICDQVIG